jgi:molybdate transport system permease protein
MNSLLQSLILSLRIATIATVVTALVAVPLAFFLARHRFTGKSLIETLLTLPLVLPPTVVGYAILRAVGLRTPLGAWLHEVLGVRIVFSEAGAVLAATVVSLPLLLLPAKAAFASIEHELEDVARLMGAGPIQLFWHVSLPIARRGIASGLLLAFARSMGEFGATLMVFGMGEGRMTLPISVYMDYESGGSAVGAVCVLTVVSLSVIYLYNRSGADRRE